MTKVEMEKHRKSWRIRVADFRVSGLSGAAWGAANQVKNHQLGYWSAKFPVEGPVNPSEPSWVMVQSHEPVAATEHPLLVRIVQGAQAEKKSAASIELGRVVETVADFWDGESLTDFLTKPHQMHDETKRRVDAEIKEAKESFLSRKRSRAMGLRSFATVLTRRWWNWSSIILVESTNS